jgi:hypothetical protein
VLLLAAEADGRALLYNRQAAPAGWERLYPADPSDPVSFTLVLEGSNSELLEERFWQVSDPEHEQYGEFMTPREIEDLVKPESAAAETTALSVCDRPCQSSRHPADCSLSLCACDAADVQC